MTPAVPLPTPGRPGPVVMGIVNVTPDSFSDGGRWASTDLAVAHGTDLSAAGADLLDVGGESTRPGATRPVLAEELDRGLREAGVTLSDAEREHVIEQISAGAEVDVERLGAPEGGPA